MRSIRKLIPRRWRHFILGWMARLGFAAGRMLPRRFGLFLFSSFGAICYYLLSADRKRTIRNLKFIFGNKWCDRKIRVTAKSVFKSLGKNQFDAIKLNTLSAKMFDATVSHDSLEGIEAAMRRGKGGLLITAHTGCFEMLLHFSSRKGFRSVAIGREFKNQAIDEVVRKMRSGPGIAYMDKSENSRKIVRMLQEGRVLGVLIDQDTRAEGVFADFLGRTAFTPSGAVRFAMKFKIPIFVLLAARINGDKHHISVSPELTCEDTWDFEAGLLATVQRINDIISGHILKYPEQWVWMHERWKTRPRQTAGTDELTSGESTVNKEVIDK